MDETYIRVGQWNYLYRALDSTWGNDRLLAFGGTRCGCGEAFFQRALRVPGRGRPRVVNVDGNPSYPKVITELKQERHLGHRLPLSDLCVSE